MDLQALEQAINYLEKNYTWWRIEKESSNLYRVIAVEVDGKEVVWSGIEEGETLDEVIKSCMVAAKRR